MEERQLNSWVYWTVLSALSGNGPLLASHRPCSSYIQIMIYYLILYRRYPQTLFCGRFSFLVFDCDRNLKDRRAQTMLWDVESEICWGCYRSLTSSPRTCISVIYVCCLMWLNIPGWWDVNVFKSLFQYACASITCLHPYLCLLYVCVRVSVLCFVCVRVCICVYVFVSVRGCVCVCKCVYTYLHIYISICVLHRVVLDVFFFVQLQTWVYEVCSSPLPQPINTHRRRRP